MGEKVKKIHELKESGEMKRFIDEMAYIMDGLMSSVLSMQQSRYSLILSCIILPSLKVPCLMKKLHSIDSKFDRGRVSHQISSIQLAIGRLPSYCQCARLNNAKSSCTLYWNRW